MMSKHKKIGDDGENMALGYLLDQGYTLMERNYRYSRGEIDLIVRKNNVIVFVEVKTRTGNYFGFPEEWVDDKKEAWIIEVADYYIHDIDWLGSIRFDIVAILKGQKTEIRHFEDAFY